ncbi:thiamine pyrophosphate-dependent enzyme [Halococcoides cellulosivorans]|uniref:2-ketoglutarate ferredoxin oxidoreductase subunit beta n=1 Tax=Halococcoides cellulosivorans TaxID=1679096 RepID=A0A2R4X1C7_9EURY|nr:thiamine pyrophosphate-dependent enzyme [Halococcoides cellulosivorans]AWB27591.1 2-ketoglutarate ferredoxin oxidoreductase subunit beta [Halococcoides cellulosivorans]
MSTFSAIDQDREIDREEFTPGVEPQPTWCPGCGDFAVLKALKGAMADIGRSPEEVLTVTGIGCSSKLNSYFGSYGFHTIHGRPLPVARAAKLANPDLEVVAAGGDGDGYGIGANHFLHSARENHDMTYIVFNNEIFGLTKGQTSPTSPMGHTSKTQPSGNAKSPIRPLSLALTAGATYVARTAATNPRQAQEIVAEAIEHDGFAHIDFLTQCPTWNKDAKSYVPYTDVQDSDEYDFDVSDHGEANAMMRTVEDKLYEGEILTGRFYVEDGRPSYGQKKREQGEMPAEPLAQRYFEDGEWERSIDFVKKHT